MVGDIDKKNGTGHTFPDERDLCLSQQQTADVEYNQSQPQTQHRRCQFPTNHRNSFKQLFSDLISESLLSITFGLLTTPLCSYHETTTQKPAALAANQPHLFQQKLVDQLRHHQATGSCTRKHLNFPLPQTRSSNCIPFHERQICSDCQQHPEATSTYS